MSVDKDSIYPITVNPKLKNGLNFYDIHAVFVKNGFDFCDRNAFIMTAQISNLIGFENERDAKYCLSIKND